jgi:cytochrome d ubiquinol oxidase subunit II
MDLNTIWFLLIAVLFTGFFILEGFDYGVGILLPFLGKEDKERRMLINSIGPFWDGNEVWLITAGGAMFAAFPDWYATLFSGFYLALGLMLLTLIVRGVGFEFRSKDIRPGWRKTWDWMIFAGSFVPAFLWGVAMSNLIRGVPIDDQFFYVGSFWDLLNPYSLLAGLTSLSVFTLHGAIFLSLKLEDPFTERVTIAAKRLWPVASILLTLTLGLGFFTTDMHERLGILWGLLPLIAVVMVLMSGWFMWHRRFKGAFLGTVVCIALSTLTIFKGLYPRLMISSLNPEWHLTIYNASSSDYTLKVMAIVALIFTPIVLLYQGWSYWIFRKRISQDSPLEY